MSGINEIKKKAKISIDEMYDQPDEMKAQKEINQAKQEFHLNNNPISHEKSLTASPQFGKSELLLEPTNDFQASVNKPTFPLAKQQPQKQPTYRMTFILTERIYKAFNDLYAQRILDGCKTDKSELICEAIQWLIKMEEK